MKSETLKIPLIFGFASFALALAVIILFYGINEKIFPVFLVLSVAIGIVNFGSVLIMKRLAVRLYKSVVIDLQSDEEIIYEAGANHSRGMFPSGGRLVLTNKRLIFKTHKNNSEIYELSLQLSSLKMVSVTKRMKLMRRGLKLESTDNKTIEFTVENPDMWVDKIQDKPEGRLCLK